MTPDFSPDQPRNNSYSDALVDMEYNETSRDFYRHGRYLNLAQFLLGVVPTITCSITRLDESNRRSDLNTSLRFACATFIGSVLRPVDVFLNITADHFEQKAYKIQKNYTVDYGVNTHDSGRFNNANELSFSETSLTESIVEFIREARALTRIILMDYFNRF